MVVADFNILCLKQRTMKVYKSPSIKVDTFKISNISEIYGEKWSVLSAFNGYGYSVYPVNKKNDYDYSRGFFDLEINNEVKNIVLADLEMEKLAQIIDFYINQSPIKKICVLIRLDWSKDNTLLGTIGKDEFFSKLEKQELSFNTAYIIEEKILEH